MAFAFATGCVTDQAQLAFAVTDSTQLYSGVDCGVVCSGFGTVSNNVCKCNPGHGGVDCSLLCPGCLHGACNTTAPYINGAYPANAAVVCPPCDPGWCVGCA
jgi:hypothetical protein